MRILNSLLILSGALLGAAAVGCETDEERIERRYESVRQSDRERAKTPPDGALLDMPAWMNANDPTRTWDVPSSDYRALYRVGIRVNPETRKAYLVTYVALKDAPPDTPFYISSNQDQGRTAGHAGRAYDRIERVMTDVDLRGLGKRTQPPVFVTTSGDGIGVCDAWGRFLVPPTRVLRPKTLSQLLKGESVWLPNRSPAYLDTQVTNKKGNVEYHLKKQETYQGWIQARLEWAYRGENTVMGGESGINGSPMFVLVSSWDPVGQVDAPGFLEIVKAADGRCGVSDLAGAVILKAEYDEISAEDFDARRPFVRIRQGAGWGALDMKTREVVLAPKYAGLAFLGGKAFAARETEKGRWAVAVIGGEITAFAFAEIGAIQASEELQVREEPAGKWALADRSGRVMTPYRFDRIVRSANQDCFVTRSDTGVAMTRRDGTVVATGYQALNGFVACGKLGFFALAKNAAGAIGAIDTEGRWRDGGQHWDEVGAEWNRLIGTNAWDQAMELTSYFGVLSEPVGFRMKSWTEGLRELSESPTSDEGNPVYFAFIALEISQKSHPDATTAKLLRMVTIRYLTLETAAAQRSFIDSKIRISDDKWKQLKKVVQALADLDPAAAGRLENALFLLTEEHMVKMAVAEQSALRADQYERAMNQLRADREALHAGNQKYWADFNRNSADNRFKAWVQSGNSQQWRLVPE